MAYKCFEGYNKAKYYKEAADTDGSNSLKTSLNPEIPESQLRYGVCLHNGVGVNQNLIEATKYFRKAADNGLVAAMFNVGNLYYSGRAGYQEIFLGEKYVKLAACKNHQSAIEFCKVNKIML
ncbi:21091_t:CDS:2 [Cetraspora pellucida]|uniref:21091_t:CDS:1 n=1 Tax=Cetraspora pellucida TaxID=1433469 RepID=A0A9N9NCF1_9GLOM|nr:21091_t:CDS:2 [Cetraspora pellucida]